MLVTSLSKDLIFDFHDHQKNLNRDYCLLLRLVFGRSTLCVAVFIAFEVDFTDHEL